MSPAVYRVETPRLVLRCWSPEDAPLAKRAEDESRDHLRRFMPWADHEPEPLADIVDRLRVFRSEFDTGEDFIFGVFSKADGSCVGGTGLHPRVGAGGIEIGYWVHAAHVRNGFATEVAGALTRVAFEIGRMRWVEIRCASANVASAGIPRRLGFVHEATLAHRLLHADGTVDDALVFTMLARDYATSAAKRIAFTAFDASGVAFARSSS